MNKNKYGQETKWSLKKLKPIKDYPCTLYIWADETGTVQYQRSVEPIGFMPLGFDNLLGMNVKYIKGFTKVSNHKMTDVELRKVG